MPLFSTKMMPLRAARSSTRGLPPCGLGGSDGSSGSMISHSSSLTNSLAISSTYPDPIVLKGSLSLPNVGWDMDSEEAPMRKVIASELVSLDGVVESPQNWHFPYFNDQMAEAIG